MTTRARTPSRTVTSRDGTPIAVFSSGSGPALLMVHGTTADHTRWAPLLPLLEPRATVHAMDRRGRGASGDAPGYALEREFEDVVAVAESIAAETGSPIAVYGHSYGALCALGAATMTDAIGRLVLYEPPGAAAAASESPATLERIQALIDAGERDEALVAFMREIVGLSDEAIEAMRAMPAWAARLAAAHTIPREEHGPADFDPARAAGLSIPTLMVLGSDTLAWAREDTEAIAAGLTDVRTVVLEGQQHVGDLLAPELFAEHLLGFVLA